jgi:uncharacterized membrane protein
VKDTFDVIMAGYQSIEPAQKNFEAFVQLIKEKQVRSEGVILVEHDADGKVRVTQTGDHMGRKGMGWGGGVGLVVGLFSPPLSRLDCCRCGCGCRGRQVYPAQGQ